MRWTVTLAAGYGALFSAAFAPAQSYHVIDLGTVNGCSSSMAMGLNDRRQVVGYASSTNMPHAFLYSGGTMSDLGTLPGSSWCSGYGINDSGEVVGDFATAAGSYHGFLDSDGEMTDLNSLIDPTSGWTITDARAINDLGWIAANGTDAAGDAHALLLKPATAAPLPGDANGDGRVDVNDLTIVLTNFGRTGMTWSQGEFTGSGTVDVNDLTILLTYFGTGSGAAALAVPEPASLALGLAAMASAAVLFRRRGQVL